MGIGSLWVVASALCKLAGVINISWWWVFLPVWIWLAVMSLILAVGLIAWIVNK